MTWTKLGDEFSDEARDLTDAEFRTHVEALNWSNRRMLDLYVPKRDVRRFAESPGTPDAVDGLVVKGWWADCGDVWNIGLRFAEWQLERAVVEKRRDANVIRVRRHRMHAAGDHSICVAGRCEHVTHYDTRDDTRDPGRVGTGRGLRPEGSRHESDSSSSSRPMTQSSGKGVLAPLSSANPADDNGSGPPADDVQNFPIEVQRQSQATGGNARASADGRGPRPLAPPEPLTECHVCGQLVAIQTNSLGDRQLRHHGPRRSQCAGSRQEPRAAAS